MLRDRVLVQGAVLGEYLRNSRNRVDRRRHVDHPTRAPGPFDGALSPFLTCVGLVYRALLGFVIVVAWEQFSSAEINVSNEASTVVTMYRQTVGMPVPEQTQMRVLLRKYTKAVEGPEWENAIRAGSGTENARDALNEMYRVLGSEQSSVATSPVSQKFLDQLTTRSVGVQAILSTPTRRRPNGLASQSALPKRSRGLGNPTALAEVDRGLPDGLKLVPNLRIGV